MIFKQSLLLKEKNEITTSGSENSIKAGVNESLQIIGIIPFKSPESIANAGNLLRPDFDSDIELLKNELVHFIDIFFDHIDDFFKFLNISLINIH